MTTARQVLGAYLVLTVLSTLASSLIWGINTLFLLDAGLGITGAFAANACFTAGQVLFELPTGVVADTRGRRASFLLGAATLFSATLLYYLLWLCGGPFWAWAATSVLLGLGFTFFSGATEAWLVDGLRASGYTGTLESAFAKGEIAGGIAMLAGSVAGGAIAQVTGLGVPYLIRAALLALTFVLALLLMHDIGFTPRRDVSVARELRALVSASLRHGLGNPPVRWLMLAAPFEAGVGFYAFYAMQPYLLELYGESESYAVAGLAAALVAAAQIVGGLVVPRVRRAFARRTTLLLVAAATSAGALALMGLAPDFRAAIGLLALWSIADAIAYPLRQAFINDLIPSAARATLLSSDNLLGSSGGVVIQPGLGRVADGWGYPASYLAAAAIHAMALPFVLLARRENTPADAIRD